MTKIVINKCFGGFRLSEKGLALYNQLSRKDDSKTLEDSWDIERDDPILVKVVETLGKESWSKFSELKVITIPDGVNWEINEYDGVETIHEIHRSWS